MTTGTNLSNRCISKILNWILATLFLFTNCQNPGHSCAALSWSKQLKRINSKKRIQRSFNELKLHFHQSRRQMHLLLYKAAIGQDGAMPELPRAFGNLATNACQQFPLSIDEENIDIIEAHKHLGVILSTDLKWKAHLESILAKARKWAGLLRHVHVSHQLPAKLTCHLYI